MRGNESVREKTVSYRCVAQWPAPFLRGSAEVVTTSVLLSGRCISHRVTLIYFKTTPSLSCQWEGASDAKHGKALARHPRQSACLAWVTHSAQGVADAEPHFKRAATGRPPRRSRRHAHATWSPFPPTPNSFPTAPPRGKVRIRSHCCSPARLSHNLGAGHSRPDASL